MSHKIYTYVFSVIITTMLTTLSYPAIASTSMVPTPVFGTRVVLSKPVSDRTVLSFNVQPLKQIDHYTTQPIYPTSLVVADANTSTDSNPNSIINDGDGGL